MSTLTTALNDGSAPQARIVRGAVDLARDIATSTRLHRDALNRGDMDDARLWERMAEIGRGRLSSMTKECVA